MVDILIRDLDPAVHAELKRRAAEEHVSLQVYVSRVLGRHARRPTIAQWLGGLDELPRHAGVSGAGVLNDARRELP